ncbi:hypothetical protein PF011_g30546 [Phytophthora fragariae]|uniref:Uncharacterized protein n=1 Tax=Phytophthora fragariae TaxID=53985 RepID=A0A6A3GQI5_9STRA|nr:hypothetical protein PF011_g30546 [Phytophthora fragariae]
MHRRVAPQDRVCPTQAVVLVLQSLDARGYDSGLTSVLAGQLSAKAVELGGVGNEACLQPLTIRRKLSTNRGRFGVGVGEAPLERGGHLPVRLQDGFCFSQPLEELQPFGSKLVDPILSLVKLARRLHAKDIGLHTEIHLNVAFVLRILR